MTAIQDTAVLLTPQPSLWSRLIPYAGMVVIALLVWLPFGFKTTGLVEELGVTEMLDGGAQLFFITPTSPDLAQVRSRPLQIFPFALSYTLDPNSYIGYNLLMLVFCAGKMVAAYWLVLKFLPQKRLLAWITAVLFALYPADTGLFATRIIHGHFAVMAYLFAAYGLVMFWEQQGRQRGLALVVMILGLTFSVWQYQIALAACLVTPVVLLYFTHPNKRFLVAAGAWYSTLGLLLAYSLWAARQSTTTSYEGALLPNGITLESIQQMLSALLLGYRRQFTGWAAAFNQVDEMRGYAIYILVGLGVTTIIGWRLLRRDNSSAETMWRRYTVLWLGGVVFFAVGVATFIPIPTRQSQDFRIYLLAMLGSAWVLTLTIYLLSRLAPRYRDALFIGLTLPFVGLALVNAMQLQQTSINFSLRQQSLVQQVIAHVPTYQPGTRFVLLDDGGLLNHLNLYYYGIYWRTALRYIYSDPTLEAYYCPPEGGTSALSADCTFDAQAVQISNYEPESLALTDPIHSTATYANTLLFRTSFDGGVHLVGAEEARSIYHAEGYDPQALIVQGDPPYRAATMFSCNPALSCYRFPPPVSTLDLDLQQDIGTGWREAEPAADGSLFRWSTNPISTVEVHLNTDSDLRVEFKVLSWMVDDATMDNLTLALNGEPILLSLSRDAAGGRIYSAVLPRAVLAWELPTRLILTIDHVQAVPDAAEVKLGFALNWLRIRPAS